MNPYGNLNTSGSAADIQPRRPREVRSGSVGILPGIYRPLPVGKLSLAEYGNNP